MLNPTAGRVLCAAGAILLLVSLHLAWYHVGAASLTPWDGLVRLRAAVLAGALLALATTFVARARWALAARTLLGVALAALIVRRIVEPPTLSAPVTTTNAVYPGLVAALAVAFSGLTSTTEVACPAH